MAPWGHRKSASAHRMAYKGNAHEPVVGFKSEKAAQIASFFIAKSRGKIEKIKLAKLGYLSEREFINRYDLPMTYDELYSLQYGPICSSSLDGIEGKLSGRSEWRKIHTFGNADTIRGASAVSREELSDLSDAEVEVIEDVWKKYGHLNSWGLRDFTHAPGNIPEYVEVQKGRRLPIKYEDMLKALGRTDEETRTVAEEIESHRLYELAFER